MATNKRRMVFTAWVDEEACEQVRRKLAQNMLTKASWLRRQIDRYLKHKT